MSEEERGSKINDQEKKGIKDDEARLEIISKSIKGIAAMSQVGITYCIVIPGHGIREDFRLGSNYIAPPNDRPVTAIMNEVNGNIVAILESYMNVIRKCDFSEDAAEGMIDEIVKTAKHRFEETWAGIGQGAGPQ